MAAAWTRFETYLGEEWWEVEGLKRKNAAGYP
jgi:hypothetical protein